MPHPVFPGRPAFRIAALSAALLAPRVSAAPVRVGHVEVGLIPEATSIQPGGSLTVALRLKADARWHTYWINPGDTGLATTVVWKLPPGFAAGPILWPCPQRLRVDSMVLYGYEGQAMLLARIAAPRDAPLSARVRLAAHVSWLVCADVCVPGEADVEATLPVEAAAPRADPRWAGAFREARSRLPAPAAGWRFTAEATKRAYRVTAEPAQAGERFPASAYYFNRIEGVIEPSGPQTVDGGNGTWTVTLPQSAFSGRASDRLVGVWAAEGEWAPGVHAIRVDIPVAAAGPATVAAPSPSPTPSAAPRAAGWMGIAVTAFLGGLILNLMPCVFPVLSLKIIGFVKQAGQDRRRIASHGWAFTAGVLASFWILAGLLLFLRSGGRQLGWGFQLQSPSFVLVLCFLLTAFALSLLGVFEIGARLTAAAAQVSARRGLGGAFLNGAVATVLATPCTAPFMGTALAFAMTQPAAVALAVFTALAAGMAAPYLALSLRPGWLRFLPRPGAWMEAFKQIMAFPLLGTVVWLLWVFGLQTGVDGMMRALASLLILAAALWLWGRWGAPGRAAGVRRMAAAAGLLVGLFAAEVAWHAASPAAAAGGPGSPTGDALVWEKFTPARLDSLVSEGRPVFIDFTAGWCASCIANEKWVIDTAPVRTAFKDKKVVLLKADWTRRDPAVTQALARYGKDAVPLHVLYGGRSAAPLLVKEIVTKEDLLNALKNVD